MPRKRRAKTVRTAVWMRPEQAELVRSVADLAGLDVVIAGSPEPRDGAACANLLKAEHSDDLRAMLRAETLELALLADPGDLGADQSDPAAALAASARGAKLVTLEPVPATAIDLGRFGWLKPINAQLPIHALRLAPLPRRSKLWAEAEDVLSHFGRVRSAHIELCRPASAASLGATAFAALDLAIALVGDPETVHAADAPVKFAPSLRPQAGESLRELSGELAITMGTGDGRLATIVASDSSPRSSVHCTLTGEGGRLAIWGGGLVWIDTEGAEADRVGEPGEKDPSLAEQIARAIDRELDQSAPAVAPVDHESVLAVAQAALLSLRTHQAENPLTIRRMVGAG